MAGCGSEMQNATSFHFVCIRIPKEQEREMIFDLHQRLLSTPFALHLRKINIHLWSNLFHYGHYTLINTNMTFICA